MGVEQLIVEQDRAGIRKAALVQASTCYGHDNSYVADAVEAHPDRFTGVFSCDILAPDACDTMAHWMARGLTGLRLFTTGSTMPGQAGWLDDPRSFPAWRKAEEERPSRLPADDGGRDPADRERAASAFPACAWCSITLRGRSRRTGRPTRPPTVCGGSPGFPASTSRSPNATSSARKPGRPRRKRSSDGSCREFGASRIAWGSNFPASERSLPELLALAQDALRFLPETDREWIFSRTAQTLYPALATVNDAAGGATRHAALAARQPRRHRGA